jgi:hypothetical protein
MSGWSVPRTLLVSCFALSLVSCGYPLIPLGQKISGTLTDKDNLWYEHDPYTGAVSGMGYSIDYQVQATAGTSYTVTFWTSTGNGNFVDDENGRFYWPDGSAGSALVLVPSNPQTVTWKPSKTGLNKVDVEASSENVPLDFTVEITQQ